MPRYNVKGEFEVDGSTPEEAQENAAEAVRWYILATGELAADGIGDPEGWVTVEELRP
jgi:hypothetical protein